MAAASGSDGSDSDGSFADWEEEDASDVLVSALTGAVVASIDEWWQELSSATGFDFPGFISRSSLDYHGKVRLVNLCRSSIAPAVAQGNHEVALKALEASETWSSDELLVPVLKDDAVLRHLDDEDWSDEEDGASKPSEAPTRAAPSASAKPAPAGEDVVSVPRHVLEALRRAAAMGHRLIAEAAGDGDGSGALPQATSAAASAASGAGAFTASGSPSQLTTGSRGGGVSEAGYFGGYAETGIHVEMLQDVARTSAYRTAIQRAVAALGQGCSVVDVGAGTGILSLFAARAGARATAIEASPLAHHATATAIKSGLSAEVPESGRAPGSGSVAVLHRRAETVAVADLPGSRQCDAVVSEWMGYALLFEDMLPAVIRARDTLLRPGGMLLPDRAAVLVAAVSDRRLWRRTAGFWRDAWGFDMSHLQPRARVMDVRDLHPLSLASAPARLADLDLLLCNEAADLEPSADLELRLGGPAGPAVLAAMQAPVAEAGETSEGLMPETEPCLHGLALWFTTSFEGRPFRGAGGVGSREKTPEAKAGSVEPVVLSTAPHDRPTHWKQGVFWFDEPVPVAAVCGPDGIVRCSLALRRASTNRCYEACIKVHAAGSGATAVDGVWAIE